MFLPISYSKCLQLTILGFGLSQSCSKEKMIEKSSTCIMIDELLTKDYFAVQ